MLEKGTITLTSGYVPSASRMALCKHVGQTRVSKNLVCLTRGERHYRMLNNCCWHSGRGGFHSRCKTLCFPGSTTWSGYHFLLPGKNLGDSVIHGIRTSGLRESHICPHPLPEGSFLPCPFYLSCWTVSQGFSSAHLVNHIDELKQMHSAFVTVESLATASKKKVGRKHQMCIIHTSELFSYCKNDRFIRKQLQESFLITEIHTI